jgi:hypothetical protein
MGRNPVLGPWPHNATLGQPTDSGAQAAPEHGEGIELPARACKQRSGSEANGGEPGNMEARMTRTSIWIPLEPRWVGRATQKLTIEAQPRRRQKNRGDSSVLRWTQCSGGRQGSRQLPTARGGVGDGEGLL